MKYEEVYVKDYGDVDQARSSLGDYFEFYNQVRLHQSLEYHTPWEMYQGIGDSAGRTLAPRKQLIQV